MRCMRKYSAKLSIVQCPECKNDYPVYRKIIKKGRREGHVKHMWCHVCQKVQPHVQLSHEAAKYS